MKKQKDITSWLLFIACLLLLGYAIKKDSDHSKEKKLLQDKIIMEKEKQMFRSIKHTNKLLDKKDFKFKTAR